MQNKDWKSTLTSLLEQTEENLERRRPFVPPSSKTTRNPFLLNSKIPSSPKSIQSSYFTQSAFQTRNAATSLSFSKDDDEPLSESHLAVKDSLYFSYFSVGAIKATKFRISRSSPRAATGKPEEHSTG